jgi:hypothetical protein
MKESEKKGKKGKYKVKLSNRNKNEKTVDGITITQEWKRVKEKTNELELLEKKGEIIIEEVEDPEAVGKLKLIIEIDDQGAPVIKDTQGNIQKRTGAVESGTGKMSKGFSSEWASMASLMRWHPEAARIPKFIIEIDKGKAVVKDTQGNIQKLTGAGTIRTQEIQRILSLQSAPSNTAITEENLRKIVEELLNKKIDVKVEGTIKDEIENPKAEKKIEKINWLGSIEEIEFLFTLLIELNIVADNGKFEMIGNHFKNRDGKDFKYEKLNQRFEKIHWLLSEREIVYFLKELCDRSLFLEEKKFKMLSIHFKNRNCGDFKPGQLANAYQNKRKSYEKIDKIMGKFDYFKNTGKS